MDHLESKVNEYMMFSGLSDDIQDLLEAMLDKFLTIKKNPSRCDFMMTAQELLEIEERNHRKFKEHLILALYFHRICDVTDYFETFGPHKSILKLLPDLHTSIYVGPGKYDPCHTMKNNSDDDKQATGSALIEAMEKLLVENPSFEKTISVDQQSCFVMHAQGRCKKLFELVSLLKRLDSSCMTMENELNSVARQLDGICEEPTLVGNIANGPAWMLKEDHDASDFEDEYTPWETYPESSDD